MFGMLILKTFSIIFSFLTALTIAYVVIKVQRDENELTFGESRNV